MHQLWFARYVTMQNQPTTSDWAEQHEGQWWVWRDVATLRHTIICPLKYILRHQQSVAATDACVHVPYTCRAFAVDYPSSGCTHLRKSLTGTVYVRASPFTYCWTFFFFFFFFFSPLFFANPTLECSACTDMHNGDVAVKANDLVTIVDLHRWNKSGSTEFWVRDV